MKRRTLVIISSFGTIAALGFAGALLMIGCSAIAEAVSCALQSEREG